MTVNSALGWILFIAFLIFILQPDGLGHTIAAFRDSVGVCQP
jgi:hypothetical protein